MTDKKKTNSSKSVEVKKDLGLAASTRRDAVKNILAGSTLAAGAATSSVWVKPVVDAVVTPAHAQTSTVFVVSGNAVVTVDKAGFAQSRNVLDMFMDSAHAGPAVSNFEGACVTMSGDTVAGTLTVDFVFFSGSPLSVTGAINPSGNFNFTDQGVTVAGAYNPTSGSASGTIFAGLSSYAFTLADTAGACTPLAPTPTTTTASPTTTGYATSTIQPTTTSGTTTTTTAAPTTTSFSTTTAAPTTTSFSTTTAAPTSTLPPSTTPT